MVSYLPMATIFTKIANGEIPCHNIWEDERFFAFLDIHPVQPGMTLIIPKREIDSAFEMEDDEYCAFLRAAKDLVGPIQRAMGVGRVGLVIEGLEVPHAHIKLIPLSKPQDLHAPAQDATDAELAAVAEKIRVEIKRNLKGF